MDAMTINRTTDLAVLAPGVRRRGRYFIGPCPFCGGDDRFNIKRTDEGDLWICRKCGDGRYHDAVAFLMRRDGRPFAAVVAEPAAARRPPAVRRPAADAPAGPPDEDWQTAALVALHGAAETLHHSGNFFAVEAWHYLRAYRGLLPDTIFRYTLGFNPTWLHLPELPGAPYLAPGIYIPCMVDGELWSLKTRVSSTVRRDRKIGKYMALAGSRSGALFNGDALTAAHTAVVVEGEFDALLLGQFLPDGWAAVTMGSAGTLPGAAFLPYFAAVDRVRLRLDADEAGAAGLAAWRALLGRAEPLPPLPAGVKDLTEFWRGGGDLAAWVQA